MDHQVRKSGGPTKFLHSGPDQFCEMKITSNSDDRICILPEKHDFYYVFKVKPKALFGRLSI